MDIICCKKLQKFKPQIIIMKKTPIEKFLEPSALRTRLTFLAGALFAGHFITTISRNEPFWITMTWPTYPLAMLFGTVVAFGLIELIYAMGKLAQRIHPPNFDYIRYLKLRFLLAVVIPLIVAPTLAALYYKAFNLNIFTETTYFRRDYIVIILMILLANVAIEVFLRMHDRFGYDPDAPKHGNGVDDNQFDDGNFVNDSKKSEFTEDKNTPMDGLTVASDQECNLHVENLYKHKSHHTLGITKKIDPGLGIIETTESGHTCCYDRFGNILAWDLSIYESSKILTPDYFCFSQSIIVHYSLIVAAWSSQNNFHFAKVLILPRPIKVARTRRKAFTSWCEDFGIQLTKRKTKRELAEIFLP